MVTVTSSVSDVHLVTAFTVQASWGHRFSLTSNEGPVFLGTHSSSYPAFFGPTFTFCGVQGSSFVPAPTLAALCVVPSPYRPAGLVRGQGHSAHFKSFSAGFPSSGAL